MVYHILNGDALGHKFSAHFTDEKIIMPEGLIDGDLGGNSLPEFAKTRAAYMQASLEEYHKWWWRNWSKRCHGFFSCIGNSE